MTTINIPLFLQNKNWYKYNKLLLKYELTTEGQNITEVVKSYNNFYSDLYNARIYDDDER